MLTQTTILCAADLISNGNSSLGTNHPRGPQDLPYANTNKKITITSNALIPFESSFPCPNSNAKTTPVIICKSIKQFNQLTMVILITSVQTNTRINLEEKNLVSPLYII